MNEKFVTRPLHCVVGGRTWLMFTADYQADGGTYSLEFYAISMEHAAAVVQDIRESLVLKGQMVGTEAA